jgi:hypothetical protein
MVFSRYIYRQRRMGTFFLGASPRRLAGLLHKVVYRRHIYIIIIVITTSIIVMFIIINVLPARNNTSDRNASSSLQTSQRAVQGGRGDGGGGDDGHSGDHKFADSLLAFDHMCASARYAKATILFKPHTDLDARRECFLNHGFLRRRQLMILSRELRCYLE